ncbi:MAG TPA: BBP7 family outer membrane beta-barrel protein [Pirellulales bacterium]
MARTAGLACAALLAMPLPASGQTMVFPSAVQPPPQQPAPAPYGSSPAPYNSPPAPGPFVPLQAQLGGPAVYAGPAPAPAPYAAPSIAPYTGPSIAPYTAPSVAPYTAPGQAPAAYTPPTAYPAPTAYFAPKPFTSPYAKPGASSPPAAVYQQAQTPFYQQLQAPSIAVPPEDPNLFPPSPTVLAPPGPTWTLDADALWLQRSSGNFGSLGETILYLPTTAVEQLNVGGFGMQPGMRLQLTYRVDSLESWEGIYFGLQQWTSAGTIYGDPSLAADYGNGPILATSPYMQSDIVIAPFAGSLGYTYSSSLNNAEINQRVVQVAANNWTVDTLLGFRFVEWNERFQLSGVNNPANPLAPVYYYEDINTSTHNTLLGGQVGYGVRRNWERLAVQFNAKAALMGNIVHQTYNNLNSTLYLTNGFGGAVSGFQPVAASRTTLGVASVLDFSAMATYQFTPHFSVRGGYQLLYIPGLALAPSQLGAFNHNQGVLLQGPSAGLAVQW